VTRNKNLARDLLIAKTELPDLADVWQLGAWAGY
jgi:hypothetical protein